MSAARLGIAALALAALAACTTVGPNYQVPDKAAINASQARGGFIGAGRAPVTQDPLPDGWWLLYQDPVLNALEARALAANTDLRVAAANLAKAQAVTREARAANDPRVSTSAAVQRGRDSGESHLLPIELPVENTADVGLRASYQLDLFGRLRRAAEAATADEGAARRGAGFRQSIHHAQLPRCL